MEGDFLATVRYQVGPGDTRTLTYRFSGPLGRSNAETFVSAARSVPKVVTAAFGPDILREYICPKTAFSDLRKWIATFG